MKLKDIIDKNFIQNLSQVTKGERSDFNIKNFEKSLLTPDWEDYELKARIRKIAQTLHTHLGEDYVKNIKTLRNASEKLKKSGTNSLALFLFPDYVELYGLGHWQESMQALEHLTQHSTAEFAIRAFFKKDFEKTLYQMKAWSKHKNYHIRRLSSEGSRPRLPWGQAVPELISDIHTLEILEALKSDGQLYVRKSVANHLNDISKKFPEEALKIGSTWYGKDDNQNWIVKHAFRGLLKKGNPKALKVFGFKNTKDSYAINNFKLAKEVKLGSDLVFSLELDSKKKQKLRVEFAMYFLRANGQHNKKVFLISEKEFTKGLFRISKKYSFKKITTRKYYKGKHTLGIIVNGVEVDRKDFKLV